MLVEKPGRGAILQRGAREAMYNALDPIYRAALKMQLQREASYGNIIDRYNQGLLVIQGSLPTMSPNDVLHDLPRTNLPELTDIQREFPAYSKAAEYLYANTKSSFDEIRQGLTKTTSKRG